MITTSALILPFVLFLIIAILYSSVGHAGASGYLAVMAILSFAPESIKPTSLILNIVVAAITSYKFIKAGYFDKKIFLSFIVTALPLAFLGGYISISPHYFKLLAGIFLILSAFFLIVKEFISTPVTPIKSMSLFGTLSIGSVIGFVSGLIGVGGGIFLSPIMIISNLTSVKNASGVAALFILCNSIAGLAGHISALNKIDFTIFYWIAAVLIGGFIGSYLGTKKFNNKVIISCLFIVLLTAGLKFIFVDFAK
jgi:uncharacterized membrane protein YfcA